MPKKRTRAKITRKQMKKDPLVTFYLKVADFARINARILVIIAVVATVCAVVVVMMGRDRARAEAEAEVILAQANKELWRGNPSEAVVFYTELLDRYAGTKSGKQGLLFRGDALLETGDCDEAISNYEKFLERERKDKMLRYAARRGIATALEDKGEFAKAGNVRESLAKLLKQNEAAEELMSAARCYQAAAMYGKAIELYERVISYHSDYWGTDEAKVSLEELRTKLRLTAPDSN